VNIEVSGLRRPVCSAGLPTGCRAGLPARTCASTPQLPTYHKSRVILSEAERGTRSAQSKDPRLLLFLPLLVAKSEPNEDRLTYSLLPIPYSLPLPSPAIRSERFTEHKPTRRY
jgi:hypothetical protein